MSGELHLAVCLAGLHVLIPAQQSPYSTVIGGRSDGGLYTLVSLKVQYILGSLLYLDCAPAVYFLPLSKA